MTDLTKLLVGGIPLLVVIFGLVEFSKSFGLKGQWLTAFSMLLGLLFGFAFKIATEGLPVGFAGWFTVTVFGLALGLTTSGFYKFLDSRTARIGP